MLDGAARRLTRAALETLAVVAYRQPVTRARVAAVRGVNVDGVLRTLVTRGLVEEAGVDRGRQGTLYRTTELFLERLGLSSVDDLPPLAPLLPDVDASTRSTRAWRRPEEDSETRTTRPDGVRLQKVLAQAGVASRRTAEELIAAGRVRSTAWSCARWAAGSTRTTAVVHVDGNRVVLRDDQVYLALNKLPGMLSTMSDDQGRPYIGDLIWSAPS